MAYINDSLVWLDERIKLGYEIKKGKEFIFEYDLRDRRGNNRVEI